MRTPTHTIETAWVKIDGEDRLRVKIDLEHDFATLYLHPETAESLRVALTAIPERATSASERPAWTVKIEGEAPLTVHALTDYDAIVNGVQHLYPSATDIRWTERGDDFEARIEVDGRSARVAFLATATPSTEST